MFSMLGKRTHPSTSMMKSGIVDSKSQLLEKRSKEVMTLFQHQTELIPRNNELPAAKLISNADLSVYNTALLKKYSIDIQLAWGLAAAYGKPNGIQNWLRELVSAGLPNQLELNKRQHANDEFNTVFTYLTYGQRDLACKEATRLNDFQLAMYITHSELKDIRTTIRNQIESFQKEGQWQNMSKFHKCCWHIIAGDLGYSHNDNFTVTEKVSWQCALGMYIWYGTRYEEQATLERYNKAIDGSVANIYHLTTVKHTAAPDNRCLWYQLLQWLIGNKSVAQIDTWPLDLVWLLGIYKPPVDESYAMKWVEDLEKIDQAELAIYAALFLSSPKQKVDFILRQCEWSDERKLLEEYHIPKDSLYLAKALNAHDEWNFDQEYKILLQGELYMQAKMSLLYFLLPRYFNGDQESIEKCVSYIKEYPEGKDDHIQIIKEALTYITQEEESDDNKSTQIIGKLKELQSEFGGRNTTELFDDLIKAVLLKV